jgi:mannose-1-phosphate guanylyltransferase
MADLHVVILAGGGSSRLWPMCGDDSPKYMMQINGKSLIRHAWDRAYEFSVGKNIHVATSRKQSKLVIDELHHLLASNVIIEERQQDTAAAISQAVAAFPDDAWVLVIPADQIIEPSYAIAKAAHHAMMRKNAEQYIHLFGVHPDRPEGGFGYIQKMYSNDPDLLRTDVSPVGQFIEKPGEKQAERLIEKGWLWNSGCFLFTVNTFWKQMRMHLPEHVNYFKQGVQDIQIDKVSIDHGLIERLLHDCLRVVELDVKFDDIGTWEAAADQMHQTCYSIDGINNVGIGADVIVVGESNLIVVVRGKNVLVLKRGNGQTVKAAASYANLKESSNGRA